MSVEAPRKVLHSKRSFGKYPRNVDSPAYDASVLFSPFTEPPSDDPMGNRSEEDNDPLTDDGASTISIPSTIPAPIAINRHATNTSSLRAHGKPSTMSRVKHQLASSLLSDSDGVDSPTYDGDVESSATAGADTISSKTSHHHHHYHSSSTSTLSTPDTPAIPSSSHTTPITEHPNPMPPTRATKADSTHPVFISQPVNINAAPLFVPEEPAVAAASEAAFDPAALTPEDIQAYVQEAIDGESWRTYKINPPPTDRPIRVYADGLCILFPATTSLTPQITWQASMISSTLGNPAFSRSRPVAHVLPSHALQLRQAKLSFPSVYLLVGVNSDELVRSNKAQGIMTHAERSVPLFPLMCNQPMTKSITDSRR